jgi:precorrin-2 dehydrogenase/sirohydrochlorin ferrochelatase
LFKRVVKLKQYPINLNLAGEKVLVLGGGRVAYRKLRELIYTDAEVTLISPEILPEIIELWKAGGFNYEERRFCPEDVEGYFLIISATDDRVVNSEVSRLAREEGILINVVDDPVLSNFTLPARVRRGDLLITSSTGGNLPALSREIRKKLETNFGEEYARYLSIVGELRPLIIEKIKNRDQRREIFEKLADFNLIELVKEDQTIFRERIRGILPVELRIYLEVILDGLF